MKKFTVKPNLVARNHILLGTSSNKDGPWLLLGRLAESGPLIEVRFDTNHPHVVAIFGKRGSGKSYTMGSMLESICTLNTETAISKNNHDKAILLLDTLGIFQWTDISLETSANQDNQNNELLREQKSVWRGWNIKSEPLDVQVWIPKGSRTEATPINHREFTVRTSDFTADDWGYLLDLDIYQDRMGQLINDSFIKVTLEGWSEGEAHYRAKKDYSVSDLIKCIKGDNELLQTYQSETRRAVLQQLTTYLRNPLFEDEGTPISELLISGRMNILVMNRMPGSLRLVILSALVRRLLDERMVASEIEKHLSIRTDLDSSERNRLTELLTKTIPPTWLALDEAQNILPSERRTSAGEMLIRFVREGRNYGLSFMVATQQPTAIDNRLLAQVDTLIVHKLTVQGDVEYIRRNLKSNLPQEVIHAGHKLEFDELLRSLDVGQALISNTEAERAVLIDVRPRISVHGGF